MVVREGGRTTRARVTMLLPLLCVAHTLSRRPPARALVRCRYEGSGLIRSARLLVTSAGALVAPFGVSSASFIQGAIHANGDGAPAAGLFADSVDLNPTVATLGQGGSVTAAFTLYAPDGATVVASGTASGRAGDTLALSSPMTIGGPVQLWSVARPYLYTLAVQLSQGGVPTDAVNETVAVRGVAWDGERGLVLNEQNVKMRGACNHESFTGVGAALTERIDLLRVQQMRGVGMNGEVPRAQRPRERSSVHHVLSRRPGGGSPVTSAHAPP